MNANYSTNNLIQSQPAYVQILNNKDLEEYLLNIIEPHYKLNDTNLQQLSFTEIDKKLLLSHDKKHHKNSKILKKKDKKYNFAKMKTGSYKSKNKIYNPKAYFY